MRVTLAPAAKAARNHALLQAGSEAAMVRLMRRFTVAWRTLASFPEIGRVGQHPGTRELVVAATPFVLIYEVQEKRVYILDIRDSRRRK